MPPLQLHPPRLHPYRLFHLSARLRLRLPDRPSPSSSPQAPPPKEEDYYSLLLSQPLPSSPPLAPRTPIHDAAPASNPTPAPPPATATIIQGSDQGPDEPKVLFSTPLAGPSARMRGLARGERGLGRPPEPDNCCMSGCVNCVWDAYREEVEEWAAASRRKRREEEEAMVGGGGAIRRRRVGSDDGGDEGAVGDLDGVGGLDWGGEDDGGSLFEGVPVGIREFMNTEKRLRERRVAERAG